MININSYLENISEKELLRLLDSGNITKNNYECFIDYLKKNRLYSQYVCETTIEKAKIFLNKLIRCFNLGDLSIDELYELIKYNAGLELTRVSEWNVYEIHLISETSNDIKIKCNFAEFNYINKWGYETGRSTYRIIHNDKNVLWIRNLYFDNEPQYFVLKNNRIYGIKYKHKLLTIYKNIDITFNEKITDTNTSNFDNIINRFEKSKTNIDKDTIDLSEYFCKGFFYKGILFDGKWKKEISMIKTIGYIDGLLKIEIENLTYPHSGYVLFDIENNKVEEAAGIL
jgi:hypothetical protein